MFFADVVVPLPLDNFYTYSIPEALVGKIDVGYRVIVPFGIRKYYTAIVLRIHENAPTDFHVRGIEYAIDSFPFVNSLQLKLWEWISFYYICSLGEVYVAAIPAKHRLESESLLCTNNQNLEELDNLTAKEHNIVMYLQDKGKQKLSKVSKDLEINDILPFAHSLVFKGVIKIEEEVIERYKPKLKTFFKLNDEIDNAESIIGKSQKQLGLYNTLKSEAAADKNKSFVKKDIEKTYGFSYAVLKALVDKRIIIQYSVEVSRIVDSSAISKEPYKLNEYQQTAFDSINSMFVNSNVCLLHGVTSSGKTEIYIHLIQEQLKQQKQVLFLVPEIALTTQLTYRLRAVFGDKLGVYHSKINDNERAEAWLKMLSDTPFEIIIGVRSSVFLPFTRLGLVIVDEEHEVGYKQMDPAPRYHARDVAVVMANDFGAKVLLGSATPSLETYHNAISGKYGLVSLLHRFEDIQLPNIELENTKELRRKKIMKAVLTPSLINAINEALEKKEQVILFRNRRGFAPVLECKFCGWSPKCKHCDVSLTYHKNQHKLKCHYCNSTYSIVTHCPSCNEESVEQLGMGTEKLEEEVSSLFPDAVVERIDADTTSTRNSYENIITNFQDGSTDILVGTQMLSKGLDFDNVSLVGIISADGLLNHPDFRSHERGFQLMLQAAGRAGRKNKQGRVIVQAADPDMSLFKFVKANDYIGYYNNQLAERKLFRYPPFTRLISIIFRHMDESKVNAGASFFTQGLRSFLGAMVLGPNKPVISYIKRKHHREILLKIDNTVSYIKVREYIALVEDEFRQHQNYRYIEISYDVDVV